MQGLILELQNQLINPPGESAQYTMAPMSRIKFGDYKHLLDKAKKSAVCINLFVKDNMLQTLLMQRTSYGVHSNQISFPGGRVEENDLSIITTALREFAEETGSVITPTVIGNLSGLYIPPSNFYVNPVLTYSAPINDFNPSANEVFKLIEIPLHDLFNDEYVSVQTVQLSDGSGMGKVPCIQINDMIIWGATAMMIAELKAIFNRFNWQELIKKQFN